MGSEISVVNSFANVRLDDVKYIMEHGQKQIDSITHEIMSICLTMAPAQQSIFVPLVPQKVGYWKRLIYAFLGKDVKPESKLMLYSDFVFEKIQDADNRLVAMMDDYVSACRIDNFLSVPSWSEEYGKLREEDGKVFLPMYYICGVSLPLIEETIEEKKRNIGMCKDSFINYALSPEKPDTDEVRELIEYYLDERFLLKSCTDIFEVNKANPENVTYSY